MLRNLNDTKRTIAKDRKVHAEDAKYVSIDPPFLCDHCVTIAILCDTQNKNSHIADYLWVLEIKNSGFFATKLKP